MEYRIFGLANKDNGAPESFLGCTIVGRKVMEACGKIKGLVILYMQRESTILNTGEKSNGTKPN
jgi:hypothetical protein